MRHLTIAAALALLLACAAPPASPPEEETPQVHLAPPTRPHFSKATLALVNDFEWNLERSDWTRAVTSLGRLLDEDAAGLVRFPPDSRRYIPSWRYVLERARQLPPDFLQAYRSMQDQEFASALSTCSSTRDRLRVVRRYFLCTGADLAADSIANEAMECGERWLAAELWTLLEDAFPTSQVRRDLNFLRRRWAAGHVVQPMPGIVIGNGPRPYVLPSLASTGPDLRPPSMLLRSLPEEEPGWEHSHAVTDELAIRFTRDGIDEPLVMSFGTPTAEIPICSWFRERQKPDQGSDLFLATHRACNPVAIVSHDRAWIVTGFGIVVAIDLTENTLDWVMEYPRDGVWRESPAARLERDRLAILPPDSSAPLLLDVVAARAMPIDAPSELIRGTLDRLYEDSIVIRKPDGTLVRIAVLR